MARTRKRRMMNQINVVPYIDVTLVLLVIFMVTAPMTNPGVVELPQVGQTLKQTAAPLVITVKANDQVEIEGKALERDQLLFEVRTMLEKTPERAIVIAADKNVKYDQVVSLMDGLKQYKVGLLLKPAK
ncbi:MULTISPECIES: biopolymer transporter ExbD [Methylovorus]|jgi:biopolymer transport protein TolR|uniref:Biopolymer transport protein ExbD/TolR n=1 Tax=Methylovorus glucosotrophus (strain SIP3-4) TaxID=582744 RepID=C6XA97_METGS|nr:MULTISPECIES: biopolymer transporter ExbD [Methylovorus]ACT51638.1 Biopolymer transport protein ExbD/TolR [Methylovorus glucosotrophus SIP3-4]KAF0843101.1 cell division and transport-associated protein TolR [Methylovorus glucosotrophus]MCB5207917.1 biopolymer transporter ExbD [Methylovorus mays]